MTAGATNPGVEYEYDGWYSVLTILAATGASYEYPAECPSGGQSGADKTAATVQATTKSVAKVCGKYKFFVKEKKMFRE